jgi:protein gp37
MKHTKIEWATHTFNPWIGCTKVSPGCANCYAEIQDAFRKWTPDGWGRGKPRRRTSAANWKQPLKWDREAAAAKFAHDGEDFNHAPYRRPRVFCASLADWLDDEVPVAWLAALLDLIRCTPHLNWLLLTKRPQSWRSRMEAVVAMEVADGPSGADQCYGIALAAAWLNGMRPDNIWIGTTVEDQKRADERIPQVLQIPARVRFLSCEPLLGSVDLGKVPRPAEFHGSPYGWEDWLAQRIHWVICGGESGPKARPMHPKWARSLRDQCKAAGVAFLFKQWGEWVDMTYRTDFWETESPNQSRVRSLEGATFVRFGKAAAGRLLDGIEHNEFPNP